MEITQFIVFVRNIAYEHNFHVNRLIFLLIYWFTDANSTWESLKKQVTAAYRLGNDMFYKYKGHYYTRDTGRGGGLGGRDSFLKKYKHGPSNSLVFETFMKFQPQKQEFVNLLGKRHPERGTVIQTSQMTRTSK